MAVGASEAGCASPNQLRSRRRDRSIRMARHTGEPTAGKDSGPEQPGRPAADGRQSKLTLSSGSKPYKYVLLYYTSVCTRAGTILIRFQQVPASADRVKQCWVVIRNCSGTTYESEIDKFMFVLLDRARYPDAGAEGGTHRGYAHRRHGSGPCLSLS